MKFVHGFGTMPQMLLLLVDLAMIRDVLLTSHITMENRYMKGPGSVTIKYVVVEVMHYVQDQQRRSCRDG